MALIENIGEYIESRESWSQYIERLEQFFVANNIAEGKKVSVLLSTIGAVAYRTIGNLVAPGKPADISYSCLVERIL